MSERVIQFTKFIIKSIFRGVALRDFSENMMPEDIYVFHKRELNESLLNNIFEEGRKYGYDKDRCLAEINLADEKTVTAPSIEKREANLNLGQLQRGTRLDLYYNHPELGEVKIAGLVSNDKSIIVLETTIMGLQYRDVLYPVKAKFIKGEPTYFRIRRDTRELTSDLYLFVPGKLKYMEIYTPSLVFNILDSDKTFRYEESKAHNPDSGAQDTKQPETSNVLIMIGEKYYASFSTSTVKLQWQDKDLIPVGECNDKTKFPFIVSIESDKKAIMTVNPLFQFNKKRSLRTYEFNHFQFNCLIEGDLNADCKLKTVKEGILDRMGKNGWRISMRLKVKCIKGIDEKLFRILRDAIVKVLNTIITPADMDMTLIKLGATIPFKISLIQEMEKIGKVKIKGYFLERLITIRDLYNLLIKAKNNG